MAVIKDRDITTELRGALIEVKEAMEGKRKLNASHGDSTWVIAVIIPKYLSQ